MNTSRGSSNSDRKRPAGSLRLGRARRDRAAAAAGALLAPLLPAATGLAAAAIHLGDAMLDLATLGERAEALARALAATPPEGVTGIRIGNEPAFLVAFLACWRAGRPAVPLDPRWTAAETARALRRIDLSLLLHTGQIGAPGPPACRLDPWGRVLTGPGAVTAGGRGPRRDIAVVHWSSGSTGTPKPIAVSRRALRARIASLVAALGLDRHDRVLCFVPLNHCHGLDCIALPALVAGAQLVLLDPLAATPGRVAAEIAGRGVTVFSAFPRFYEQLLRDPPPREALGTVRLALCGSAALGREVAREFRRRFGIGIRTGYGLTEVGLVAMSRPEEEPAPVDSVGRALPGIECRIHDADAAGVGELWVRSPGCADGYLLDDPGEPSRLLEGGWLHTRDLARIDAGGHLYLSGRTSDFINVDGAKADPREIEQVIAALPWVAECAVRGIAGGAGAERVAAYVVAGPGPPPADPREAVRRQVAENLSLYKVPAEVILLAALPRSALGKVLDSLLPVPPTPSPPAPDRRAGPEVEEGGSFAPRDAVEEAVAAIWCEVLRRERVGVQEHFTDLGGTSLDLAEIQRRLGERFGARLTLVDLFRYPTVADQAAFLARPTPLGGGAGAATERARLQRQAFRTAERRRAR